MQLPDLSRPTVTRVISRQPFCISWWRWIQSSGRLFERNWNVQILVVQKLRLLLIKMIREEVKTNQVRLDHHEQWAVWGVFKTKTQKRRRKTPGEVLPYKSLMGKPGYVFGIFVLNRAFFVLIRVSILSIFHTGYLFLDDKQPAGMFYECLKQGIKIRILS